MGQACSCDVSKKSSSSIDEPWHHPEAERRKVRLRGVKLFQSMADSELAQMEHHLESVFYSPGDKIIVQGQAGDACFIMDEGQSYAEVEINGVPQEVKRYNAGDFFGERSLLRNEPRAATVIASSEVKVFKLSQAAFAEIIKNRDIKENLIRGARLFETMTDDQVSTLASLLTRKTFKAGHKIILQGEPGLAFYILEKGECVATVKSGSSEQEVKRYQPGDLFGEKALLEDAPRGATISAVADVQCYLLSREDFEKNLGPLSQLKAEQYLADPRKLIADFYRTGDARGPRGTLEASNLKQDLATQTHWFAVYRPCSRDSIAKMVGQVGVGKGLNVKGKSSKKNRLSAFVPFLQISDNDHKEEVEDSPADARTKIFYKTAAARDTAKQALNAILDEDKLKVDDPLIKVIHTYSDAFGLDVPEPVMKEAYIMRPDISPMLGWETGRDSEPAFMDMNLHAVREKTTPEVVLYQFDETDAMNPLGLLIAYAEKQVKPVVSDFDTFTVGSRGMRYAETPEKQTELIKWSLGHTLRLVENPTTRGWTSRWLGILKEEANKGFHPTLPRYGYGDPTSYSLIADIVEETSACGAVRHGAECFNFYFPQELDKEFLVVWDGFSDPPWQSHSEPELREFLLARIDDGFTFPINPVWPVRDPGWAEVLQKLKKSPEGQRSLRSWFPPETGIVEMIEDICAKHPECFAVKKDNSGALRQTMTSAMKDVDGFEMADLVSHEVKRVVKARWKRIRTALMIYAKMQAGGKHHGAGDDSSPTE
eukprot:TRINITY_DN28597_c0_g1_i1.p1 TRINITY_DN28597_c0_g1~~TRINITY_DN28597_c0_g1_i1.p1  ORF type:complete len:767 (+),score=166.02 TRINITY_DN28597_c0_g1_i1:31-2331(+)